MRRSFALIPFYLILVLFGTVACGPPKDVVPTATATDDLSDLQMATTLGTGSLSGNNGYTSEGDVTLLRSADGNTVSVVFENFNSSNGPDLKVYVATDHSLVYIFN